MKYKKANTCLLLPNKLVILTLCMEYQIFLQFTQYRMHHNDQYFDIKITNYVRIQITQIFTILQFSYRFPSSRMEYKTQFFHQVDLLCTLRSTFCLQQSIANFLQ